MRRGLTRARLGLGRGVARRRFASARLGLGRGVARRRFASARLGLGRGVARRGFTSARLGFRRGVARRGFTSERFGRDGLFDVLRGGGLLRTLDLWCGGDLEREVFEGLILFALFFDGRGLGTTTTFRRDLRDLRLCPHRHFRHFADIERRKAIGRVHELGGI